MAKDKPKPADKPMLHQPARPSKPGRGTLSQPLPVTPLPASEMRKPKPKGA